jgi:hypothetical protein
MNAVHRAGAVLLALSLLTACAGLGGPVKQEMILGAWHAEFQGQDMTLVYGEEEITVPEFGMTFHYEWIDDDHIRLDALGQEIVSQVEFETPDRMIQTSDSGGRQVMERVR